MSASRRSRCVVALGATIHATDRGVVIRGRRAARVDFGSREFETRLVDLLRHGGDPRELCGRHTEASVQRALGTLIERSVVIEQTFVEVNLLDGGAIDSMGDLDAGDRVVVVALAEDARLDGLLERAAAAGASTLLVWPGASETIAVSDDGRTRPCARCALFFDREAARFALPVASASDVQSAIAVGQFAICDVSRAAALLLAKQLAWALDSWPAPGEAIVVNATGGVRSIESFPVHPGCSCRSRPARAEPGPFCSSPSEAIRRFTPIAPIESTDSAVARFLYRRSSGAWPRTVDAFGAATASGEAAELRAFAEGIERFAMLHAPPDVCGASWLSLGPDALDRADLDALLFRPEDRRVADFRHPELTDELELDWSWATNAEGGSRRLIPTSLIGRAPAEGPSLVDATSNGYAAHTDAERAASHAVLELVERDAVLACWYLSRPCSRIDIDANDIAADFDGEVAVLLATQDIDLPVVWLLARRADGVVRAVSGAASCFDRALERACAELGRSLESEPLGEPRDPFDAALRHRPSDHLAYYSDPGRCDPLIEQMRSPVELSASELRRRWPDSERALRAEHAVEQVERAGLELWLADRSLPDLFGEGWRVARAVVPGLLELSWGMAYRRIASARAARWLAEIGRTTPWPHPFA